MTDEMKLVLLSNALIMNALSEMVDDPREQECLFNSAAYINDFVGKEENHESD